MLGAHVWGSGDPGEPLEREAGPGRPPPPALHARLALRERKTKGKGEV